jgi:MFS family permease
VVRSLIGLFAAEVISTTGTEMTAVALPWFVLVTSGSPTRMGAVLAAEFVGMSVLGLWGGRVATILGPRKMMLSSDLVRAGLVGLIPVAYWLGALSFPLVLGIGFAVGAFFPAYTSSQRLVLAGIVGEDELRLTRYSGVMGSVNETASFVGPAFGGVLVVLIGPANVLVVDAVSYLSAFLLVATLVPAARVEAEEDAQTGVGEGLRYLFRDRALRRQVTGLGVIGIGWTAMIATLPVLALHSGGASMAGWLLGSYGGGSVLGGLISTRARRVEDRTAVWALAGTAASVWLLLLPVPVWALAGAVAFNGVCSGLFYPRFFSALTTGTPPALRARVMTSVTIAMSAPAPLGFLGAGILAQQSGSTTPSLLLAGTAATVGALVTVTGLARLYRVRIPATPKEGGIGRAAPPARASGSTLAQVDQSD